MLGYMLRQFPSHLCTKMQLHGADNKLRIKSLENLSSRSHYQLIQLWYGKTFSVQRLAEKSKAVSEVIYRRSKT